MSILLSIEFTTDFSWTHSRKKTSNGMELMYTGQLDH